MSKVNLLVVLRYLDGRLCSGQVPTPGLTAAFLPELRITSFVRPDDQGCTRGTGPVPGGPWNLTVVPPATTR